MNSKRALTTFIAATAIASVAFMGCKKDDKKKEGAKGTAAGAKVSKDKKATAAKPGDKAAPKALMGAARPAAAEGAGSFAMLPKDSDVVFGLNGAKLRSSDLFKQALPMIMAKAGPDLKKMTDCGLDPVKGLGSIVAGMNQGNDKGILRIQGFTQKQFVACAEKRKAAGDKFTHTVAGDTLTVAKADGEKVVFKWIGNDIFIGGPKADKAAVDAAAAGTNGVDKNDAMMALLKNVDTKAAIFFAVIPDKAKAAALPMGGNMNGVFGSISFDGGLKIDLGLRTGSADEAKAMVTKANGFMGMIKQSPYAPYASKLVLKSNNADVVVQLALTLKELNELLVKLKSDPMIGKMIMGRMGGGGGGGM